MRSLLMLPLFSACSPASADWHGEIGFRSQYINRGYSKSRGNPVFQARINYQGLSGWYAGTGVSQVNFGHNDDDEASVEIKPFLGWNFALDDDWRGDASVTGYIFDGEVYEMEGDYAEFNAVLSYKSNWSARISYAPDAYQRQVGLLSYELNYRQDILDELQFSAGLGYSQANMLLGQDYFYWNAGFSWFVTNHLSIDARYVDTYLEAKKYYAVYSKDFYPSPLKENYLISVNIGF